VKKIAIISITSSGDDALVKLKTYLKNTDLLCYPSQLSKEMKVGNIVKEIFDTVDGIIFISSPGICVRVIAPYIKSKKTDPAIICIPNDLSIVISVIGGHLGGANDLAGDVAKIIDAKPIITTATDLMGIKSPDMIAKQNNLYIDSMADCKKIAALIVDHKRVAINDELNEIEIDEYEKYHENTTYDGVINITNKVIKPCWNYLNLIRKNSVIGIGCRKDYDSEKMLENVRDFLKANCIHEKSIDIITTVEIKKDEKAIVELARYFKATLMIHKIEDIRKIEHQFDGSEFVNQRLVWGVWLNHAYI